jgi:hypothetical protein
MIYYSTSNVSTSGVFEYPLNPPITANSGDILAVSQPNDGNSIVKVFYIEESGIPFKSQALQLGTISHNLETSIINDELILVYPKTDVNCIDSSINTSVIIQNAIKIHDSNRINRQRHYIYPEMKFSCNGTITRWIYGSGENENDRSDMSFSERYPLLQVWRKLDANTYIKIGSTSVDTDTPIGTNLYEVIPQSSLIVQKGDIFGLRNSFRGSTFYEQIESGPINVRVVNSNPSTISKSSLSTYNINNFPLVTVEISTSVTTSLTVSTTILTTNMMSYTSNQLNDNNTVSTQISFTEKERTSTFNEDAVSETLSQMNLGTVDGKPINHLHH